MRLFTLLVLASAILSFQNKENNLSELKKLIKNLANENPQAREKAQEKIMDLIYYQAGNHKNLIGISEEIKKNIQKDFDPEVTARLKEILSVLTLGEWFNIGTSPLRERRYHTCTVSGSKIIIWGGISRSIGAHNNGAIYDVKMNTWKKMSKSPLAETYGHSASIINNKLFIWGGFSHGGNATDKGAIYDIEKDVWLRMKKSPLNSRGYHFSLVIDNKMLIWGGTKKIKYRTEGYRNGAIYDINKDKWTNIKASPAQWMEMSSAMLFKKKLIIWGGISYYKETRSRKYDGMIYDIEKKKWEFIASPLFRRFGHAAVLAKNKMIIWGGFTRRKGITGADFSMGGKFHNDGAIYDIENNKWTMMAKCFLKERRGHTGVYLNGKFLVWGGATKSKNGRLTLDDGAIYDIQENSWFKMKEAPIRSRNFHTNIIVDKKLIIWGGLGKSKEYNDGGMYTLPILWSLD